MPDNSQDPLKRPQLLPVSNATLSYWRTEPHRIDEYRSTEQLPAECDIAIIGSGMAGVATAYHLAKLSGTPMPSMVMLEARQVCSGATGRNGVSLALQHEQELDSTLYHCRAMSKSVQAVCRI